jgi:tetratricopeptide (TPR) repeat protein
MQVAGRRSMVEGHPRMTAMRQSYVGLLLSRSTYRGSFSDFGIALEAAAAGLALAPTDEVMLKTQASALGAVHEFELAISNFTKADETKLTGPYGDYLLARGDDPRPIEQARRERALAVRGYAQLVSWAAALGAVGSYDEADSAYQEALEIYRDVSPLPVAWVEFQRGLMWAERAGDPERGRSHYELAVSVLPGYVVANVHLAELEATQGSAESAVARLRVIAAVAEDPEPLARLAALLPETDASRATLGDEARARYDALLAEYPKAFLDHAAEFFMGPIGDDSGRALELAQDNLSFRQDDRAYFVAIKAARAASDHDVECELVRAAAAEPYPGFVRPSVPLGALLADALPGCGQ